MINDTHLLYHNNHTYYLVMSSLRRRPPSQQHVTFSFNTKDCYHIEDMRVKLARQGQLLNKSEIARLGLLALEEQSPSAVKSFVGKLERLRPGPLRKAKVS